MSISPTAPGLQREVTQGKGKKQLFFDQGVTGSTIKLESSPVTAGTAQQGRRDSHQHLARQGPLVIQQAPAELIQAQTEQQQQQEQGEQGIAEQSWAHTNAGE